MEHERRAVSKGRYSVSEDNLLPAAYRAAGA